jgi:Fe2+ or Zn2+ uptake regulation protein
MSGGQLQTEIVPPRYSVWSGFSDRKIQRPYDNQYEKSYGSRQHDHLICTDCHKVVEFCDPRIQTIQNTVEELFQFEVVHHSLILYASCTKENCENRKV